MIAHAHATDGIAPLTPTAAACMAVGLEAWRMARILDAATYCGYQHDGMGGGFHLWTLLRPMGGHPRHSTINQAALEVLLFGEAGPAALVGKHGCTQLVAPMADFAAVEKGKVLP